jgi:hypothetical protein
MAEAAPAAVVETAAPEVVTPVDDASELAAALAQFSTPETDVVPPGVVATPAEAPAATPTPVVDEDAKAILARMTRLEFERDQAAERATKHEQDAAAKAARLGEAEELIKLRDTDPVALLQKLGITPENVSDFVLNGPKKTDPKVAELEKRQATLDAELARLKTGTAEQARAKAQADYRASLPGQVPVTDFPLAALVHGDKLHDEVFQVQQAMYAQNQAHYTKTGTMPDPKVAAKVIEDSLAGLKAKFGGPAASQPAVSVRTPAGVRTLTNAPTTAPKTTPTAPQSAEEELELAIQILKGHTK